MEIIFSEESKNQLLEFKLAGETNILKKIRALIEFIKISPFEGLGKPEPLKYNFSGK